MRPSFVTSLALALCAFLGPFVFRTQMDAATHISVLLALCWMALFLWTIVKFKVKSLWLLIGFPFAAFWPLEFFMIASGCAHNIRNCP